MVQPTPITLDLWRNWHRVDPHATPDQIYIAFRTPRGEAKRRLLIHQFRVHLSSATDPSRATAASGVAAMPAQVPEEFGALVCEWTKTTHGHVRLAAFTLAADSLVRYLGAPKNLGFVPPTQVTFDDILPGFVDSLREMMEAKGQQLARQATMHNPQHRMMAAACNEALHWAQRSDPTTIPHIMVLRWFKEVASAFVEFAAHRATPSTEPIAGNAEATRLVQPTVKLPGSD